MTPAPVGLRCPEHSGKPQGVQRVTQAASRTVTGAGARSVRVVTMALIAINTTVYLAELAAGGSLDGTNNWIYEHCVLISNAEYSNGHLAGVANGEWWRLITSAFLHYGPIHLATNMFSLYFVGSVLEAVVGRWRYLLLYLVSGLAGSAGALYADPNSPTAGASGAIFGILGALFILERSGAIQTGGQIVMLIVINLVISYALPGISLGGHVGGLIGGVVLMSAFLRFRRQPQLCIASAAVVAVVAIVVAYAVI